MSSPPCCTYGKLSSSYNNIKQLRVLTCSRRGRLSGECASVTTPTTNLKMIIFNHHRVAEDYVYALQTIK